MTETRVIPKQANTVVFYDGGCPLCRREIKHYAGLDKAGRIQWVDITQDRGLMNALGISFEQAMRRLHVLDHDGIVVDGVRAFVAIWAELPRYRILSAAVYRFKALKLLEAVYSRFAARRYESRCSSIGCSATTFE